LRIALAYLISPWVSQCFGGNVETVIVGPADSAANKKQTITITGSAGSARGIAVDKGGNIYVTNSAVVNNSVTVYPAGGSGEVRPIANIAGHSTLLNGPGAIALDSSGKIYVANSGGSVTVYPVGSNGDVSPSATISGSSTGLDHPTGIAVDSDDNIYVTTEEGGSDRNGSVNIYRAGSNGNVAPIATISGTSTGLDRPEGIALGPPMRNP
jgi:sugar lactone lactonase YvrE